jgi:hypothetical protein
MRAVGDFIAGDRYVQDKGFETRDFLPSCSQESAQESAFDEALGLISNCLTKTRLAGVWERKRLPAMNSRTCTFEVAFSPTLASSKRSR